MVSYFLGQMATTYEGKQDQYAAGLKIRVKTLLPLGRLQAPVTEVTSHDPWDIIFILINIAKVLCEEGATELERENDDVAGRLLMKHEETTEHTVVFEDVLEEPTSEGMDIPSEPDSRMIYRYRRNRAHKSNKVAKAEDESISVTIAYIVRELIHIEGSFTQAWNQIIDKMVRNLEKAAEEQGTQTRQTILGARTRDRGASETQSDHGRSARSRSRSRSQADDDGSEGSTSFIEVKLRLNLPRRATISGDFVIKNAGTGQQ